MMCKKKKNCDHFFSDGKEPDMCDFGSVGIGRKKTNQNDSVMSCYMFFF